MVAAEAPPRERRASQQTEVAPSDAVQAGAIRNIAGSVIITNDLLRELYGPAPAWTPPVEEPSERSEEEDGPIDERDALEKLQDEQARLRTLGELAVRERQRVQVLKARVRELEARILAVRNPFLPRPQVPEEMREEWESLSAPGRVELTERQLDEIRRQLEASRARLARLEAGQAPG